MHFILTTPLQRVLKGVSMPLYLSSGAIELLLTTLTQLRLHLPAWQAGLVFGAAGVSGLVGSVLAPRLYEHGWRRSLAWTLSVAALACLGLAAAGLLRATLGFVVALISNLMLDGAVSLSFILTSTANALVTPHELRGRVNAASTMYSSLVGPALRKRPRSRKVDKCGTVLSYGASDMPIIRARSSAETRA